MELCLKTLLTTNVYDNKECKVTIHNVESSKMLFNLCFDIFCKSLVILYGTRTPSGRTESTANNACLNLNTLTDTQLDFVRKKLERINIKARTLMYDIETARMLDIIDADTDNCTPPLESRAPSGRMNLLQQSLVKIHRQPDDLELKEYIIQLWVSDNIIELSFEII